MKEQWAAVNEQTSARVHRPQTTRVIISFLVTHNHLPAVGCIRTCMQYRETHTDKINTLTRERVIDSNLRRQIFIYQMSCSVCVFLGSAGLHCPSLESSH